MKKSSQKYNKQYAAYYMQYIAYCQEYAYIFLFRFSVFRMRHSKIPHMFRKIRSIFLPIKTPKPAKIEDPADFRHLDHGTRRSHGVESIRVFDTSVSPTD
jgi:hypothetical protein